MIYLHFEDVSGKSMSHVSSVTTKYFLIYLLERTETRISNIFLEEVCMIIYISSLNIKIITTSTSLS